MVCYCTQFSEVICVHCLQCEPSLNSVQTAETTAHGQTTSLASTSSSSDPESTVSVHAEATDGTSVYNASNMPLPSYSQRVMSMLNAKNILPELDRMVEETAYHVLSCGDISSRDGYLLYGRRLYEQYNSIEFPGNEPWVCDGISASLKLNFNMCSVNFYSKKLRTVFSKEVLSLHMSDCPVRAPRL